MSAYKRCLRNTTCILFWGHAPAVPHLGMRVLSQPEPQWQAVKDLAVALLLEEEGDSQMLWMPTGLCDRVQPCRDGSCTTSPAGNCPTSPAGCVHGLLSREQVVCQFVY